MLRLAGVQQPRTTVALINESANFTCYNKNTADSFPIHLIINKTLVDTDNDKGKYLERGINWESIYYQDKHIGFNVLIQATRDNNNICIICIFRSCVIIETGCLIIVECKLTFCKTHAHMHICISIIKI